MPVELPLYPGLRILANWIPGNHICIGRNLALMEVRLATALLISKYDVHFAAGEEGVDIFREMTDLFIACPGPLQLCFEKLA